MDLLGSILGTMQKPPTMGDEERKKAKGSLTFICCSSNLFNQLLIKEHNEDLHINWLRYFKFCLHQEFDNIFNFLSINWSTKGLTWKTTREREEKIARF